MLAVVMVVAIQVGQMGRRRLAGDPARLRATYFAAFMWLAIAGPGRASWIGCC